MQSVESTDFINTALSLVTRGPAGRGRPRVRPPVRLGRLLFRRVAGARQETLVRLRLRRQIRGACGHWEEGLRAPGTLRVFSRKAGILLGGQGGFSASEALERTIDWLLHGKEHYTA